MQPTNWGPSSTASSNSCGSWRPGSPLPGSIPATLQAARSSWPAASPAQRTTSTPRPPPSSEKVICSGGRHRSSRRKTPTWPRVATPVGPYWMAWPWRPRWAPPSKWQWTGSSALPSSTRSPTKPRRSCKASPMPRNAWPSIPASLVKKSLVLTSPPARQALQRANGRSLPRFPPRWAWPLTPPATRPAKCSRPGAAA